jgi:hypothetical protein
VYNYHLHFKLIEKEKFLNLENKKNIGSYSI